MFTLQSSVLHLDVSTYSTRPVLHLDVSGQQDPELLLDVSTPEGCELLLNLLHPIVSTLQSHVHYQDVSTPMGSRAAPGRVWTTGA